MFLRIQGRASSQTIDLERNEAEDREQDWGETLASHARAQDSYATLYRFVYWFWEKADCFAVQQDLQLTGRY